ncbi:hypothetical protein BRC81_16360 [Halobacteriales archaeon QS_1_68_20]|nr:MAG: hypothetical protein BRC81_16360 [Halobacteriales archaeon QS_1_68_20]
MTDSGDDDALAALRETFGDAPVDAETYEVPPMVFERLADRQQRGALGGARAVPRRGEAVLLVRTIDDEGEWSVPGGEREPNEPYAKTAARTVHEESGLTPTVDSLLALKRFTFVDAADPDASVVGHWAWFGATDDGGTVDLQHPGVLDAGWFTDLPGDLDDAVAARIERWIDSSRSASD